MSVVRKTPQVSDKPTNWPEALWSMYVERCGIHEAEGLPASTARIRAEAEVRAWKRAVPDERAWLESLPPPPPGTGVGRRVSPECLPLRRNRPR